MDPALRSFDPAHLDTGQSLIQLLGDRSHLGHAAGQADLFTVVNDLANRGDYCCGTAQTSLCEVFYFIQVYFSLFYFQSQIFLGNIYRERRVMEGRILSDLGVTTLLSLVTNRKFAPPVSSTLVRVAASRYIFSS